MDVTMVKAEGHTCVKGSAIPAKENPASVSNSSSSMPSKNEVLNGDVGMAGMVSDDTDIIDTYMWAEKKSIQWKKERNV